MFRKIFKKILLSLTGIFLLMSLIFLIDYFLFDPQQDIGAFFGLLMMASFFGIPYLVFFRTNKNSKLKLNDKTKAQTLVSRRCKYCNSSSLKALDEGLQCEHCGSLYQ